MDYWRITGDNLTGTEEWGKETGRRNQVGIEECREAIGTTYDGTCH